jgi:transcriptional regulator GlxA family with amidase domain
MIDTTEIQENITMTLNVGIYLYDEVEVLDFAGPFQVFTTATRVHARTQPGEAKLFETMTVAAEQQPIAARGGLVVQPMYSFENAPRIEVLIIPGGVHNTQLERQPVLDWIARTATGTKITASVCTGAFLLAKAGLLDGKTVTTHWEDIQDLRAMFPMISIVENRRWVDEGRIITSAGISAGTDMSLYLVERLAGRVLAQKTARQMEYDWQEGEKHDR